MSLDKPNFGSYCSLSCAELSDTSISFVRSKRAKITSHSMFNVTEGENGLNGADLHVRWEQAQIQITAHMCNTLPLTGLQQRFLSNSGIENYWLEFNFLGQRMNDEMNDRKHNIIKLDWLPVKLLQWSNMALLVMIWYQDITMAMVGQSLSHSLCLSHLCHIAEVLLCAHQNIYIILCHLVFFFIFC